MNRNVNSHFALNPTRIDMSRSKFDRSSSVKFSANIGEVIPFYVDEVLPGDTFQIDTSKVIRMQTLLTPMMDNIYMDFYWYFVPNRLVWSHWKELMGENTDSAWIPQVQYSVPQLTSPSGGWNIGTIADYMGIPTGISNLSVNALPVRAYAKVIDDWFRDENLQNPIVISNGDSTVAGVNSGTFTTDIAKGGLPFIAGKYRDYFTSCLPSPQKGPDVTIPVAEMSAMPVIAMDKVVDYGTNTVVPMIYTNKIDGNPANLALTGSYWRTAAGGASSGDGGVITPNTFANAKNYSDNSIWKSIIPANLFAVSDGSASAATINQLRMAFQIQKLYERDARGGSRYIEVLKSHFGVTSPDSRLQRPEYLGGNRIPITINQIIQQSDAGAGTDPTPLGSVAGMSLTTDRHSDFTHSFTEHGFILGLCVARYDHTYQQGLERFWSRLDRFDYYWPVLANIGEQAVLNKEIYAQGSSVVDSDGNIIDDQVFGYQEA